MSPLWRTRFAAVLGSLLALIVGASVASGDYGLASVLAVASLAACSGVVLGFSFDVVVVGLLLIGYILGNRGFAQLSLIPGFPLFPAEAGLALGLGWLAVKAALERRLPWQVNALNIAVLLWILVAAARILPDFRAHGAMALRDFAMVYYALFFFVAQVQAAEPRPRAFLARALLLGTVLSIPLFQLFRQFPGFFIETLTFRGTPIVFLKGDLVATFMAAGAVLTFDRYERTGARTWLVICVVGIVMVLGSESRAAMAGLMVVTGWLAAARRWRWVRVQIVAGSLAAVVYLGAAVFGLIKPGADPFTHVALRTASVLGLSSGGGGSHTNSGYKADNLRFRLVWWRAVAEETLDSGPVFGLGFGHDLAAQFARQYYPESEEEFSARSPHSIVMTTFGRMGAIGTAVLIAIAILMGMRTWRALRRRGDEEAEPVYWLVAWTVFTSACFGVVLEGPMGAVVFWIVLGIAHAGGNSTKADVSEHQ